MSRWTVLDRVLWTGAVNGIAWVIACSTLFACVREALRPVPFLGALARCIVCISVWVGFALMGLLPHARMFSAEFRVRSFVAALFLIGCTITATWALARHLGDAD